MLYKKTIDGIVYTARFRGISFFLRYVNNPDITQLQCAETLFKEVLVSPNVDIDDFEDLSTFNSVCQFLYEVAKGNGEKPIPKSELKRRVERDWACWRLIYCDMANFDYNTVFNQMTPQEIEEANIALDIIEAQIKKQSRKKH